MTSRITNVCYSRTWYMPLSCSIILDAEDLEKTRVAVLLIYVIGGSNSDCFLRSGNPDCRTDTSSQIFPTYVDTLLSFLILRILYPDLRSRCESIGSQTPAQMSQIPSSCQPYYVVIPVLSLMSEYVSPRIDT